ncbi:SHOCT domain-containing protein [Rhodococcus pyridinivorans]|uniref:SHOCT domain-containing protein n=1 Tax=Rhodococcus TaxID=1827 RepID=UPI001CE2CA45|nr:MULTISPECIES: SHOCT domain-containing protein [Rhodococcus]MCD2118205.1 SHOCT domain-containing protein [Rhodococcus pyridinivorans]MCD2143582.1 SHOCT domain-containing protein [Rhodococcus pyridinivorans]MCZ4627076.1 SHOCT domain-containing protein [Rhodococcus pyridinivorans]MCZ4648386.1 SHOCT domain-containing protein [Rhodococcus pyridinivorans]MDJ0480994.1 SHOCT domain-containing protein [Rhodococcus pyridinivorans]
MGSIIASTVAVPVSRRRDREFLEQIFIRPPSNLWGGNPMLKLRNRGMETIMMGWVGDIGWAGWTVMAVCMLAFWTVVIYLVAVMFRADRTSGPAGIEHEGDPLRMLEERFARGDIDSDEFVARRQVLTQTGNLAAIADRRGQVRG